MPLPADPGQPWPPRHYAPFQEDAREAAAWYGGDPAELGALYGGAASTSRTSTGGRFSRFWSRRAASAGDSRQRIHVPLAADVAATSADLLFGDDPELTIPEAHSDSPDAGAVACEDRLNQLAATLGLTNTMLEAAEIAAGIGGVYLRPGWDHDVADHPLLDVVHADAAVPEFRWGILTAVTFWRVVSEDNSQVVRHLERHEPGVIFHGLYRGSKDKLGVKVDMADDASTGALRARLDETGALRLPDGVDGLACRYIPNTLPNRKHRTSPIGRSDCAGTESVMDALDETFTSWMRDIRLGQARLIVPDEFLKKAGRGKGSAFDLDQEIFTPLDMDPAHTERAGISDVQFKIRFEEHAATAEAHIERVVQTAGYSPQTFGLQRGAGQRDRTATEVRAAEGKTMRTAARKRRYFEPALEAVLWNLLVIDRAEFTPGLELFRPRVELCDDVDSDAHRTAETIDLLRRAQAASTLTLVGMRSPELEGDELAAEVARIQAEQGLMVNDPTGGLPPAGPDEGGLD